METIKKQKILKIDSVYAEKKEESLDLLPSYSEEKKNIEEKKLEKEEDNNDNKIVFLLYILIGLF
jgi:hypothetical protein